MNIWDGDIMEMYKPSPITCRANTNFTRCPIKKLLCFEKQVLKQDINIGIP